MELNNDTTPTQFRDERIDSIKFFLIVLVIAGHMFSREPFKAHESCKVLVYWIYMFHMPLFIFISGYFSRKKDNKSYFLGCLKLIEPLVLYHILMVGIEYYLNGNLSITQIFTPWWVLWYLLSLLYWRTILQFIPNRILNNPTLVILITFVIGLLAGFLPFDRFLSLQRTCSFLPFFFLGYYMKGKNLYLPSKYKPFCGAFLMLLFIVPIFFSQYLGNLNQAYPYVSVFEVFSRMFIYGISIPMSVAFMNICPNKPCFARQGEFTMQYYIYHALIIFALLFVVKRFGISTNFISASIFTILITITIWGMSYMPGFDKFTNPSHFFKKG